MREREREREISSIYGPFSLLFDISRPFSSASVARSWGKLFSSKVAGKRPSRAAVQQRSPAKSQKRWSPQPGHAANGALEAPKNSVLRFTACPHNNRCYQGRRFCVKTTLKKEKRARKEKSASNLAEKSQRPRAETGTLVVRDRDWLRR